MKIRFAWDDIIHTSHINAEEFLNLPKTLVQCQSLSGKNWVGGVSCWEERRNSLALILLSSLSLWTNNSHLLSSFLPLYAHLRRKWNVGYHVIHSCVHRWEIKSRQLHDLECARVKCVPRRRFFVHAHIHELSETDSHTGNVRSRIWISRIPLLIRSLIWLNLKSVAL